MITREDLDKALQQSQEQQDKGIKLEFSNISNRLDQHANLLDQHANLLGNLSAMFRNSNSVASWDDIQPVWLFDPNRSPQYYIPEGFPNKVVKFWRLSKDRNRMVTV